MNDYWLTLSGIFLGLLVALIGHNFAWWLRFHFRMGSVLLGCLGAAVFTWSCSLFMGPYTGEVSSYAWTALGAVWALALLLGIWQVWLLTIPLIVAMTGLFVDVLISMIVIVLFALLQQFLSRSLSLQPGWLAINASLDSIVMLQSSLLGALVAGLLLLELTHPLIRKLMPFRSIAREQKIIIGADSGHVENEVRKDEG